MRNGQKQRMRGRNNRKSHNPLTRVYESNGPDVKIRGTAHHVAEKYLQLARDAQTSGDPVGAENYYQHAEHYFRMIAAAQEQFRPAQPGFRQDGDPRDESYDDDDDAQGASGGEAPFGIREPQPFIPRDAQPFPPREQQQQPYERRPQPQPRAPQPQPAGEDSGEVGLPAFITGGQPPQAGGQNGFDAQGDRFPLHRRRRRHRGPRSEGAGPHGGGEGGDDAAPPAPVAD